MNVFFLWYVNLENNVIWKIIELKEYMILIIIVKFKDYLWRIIFVKWFKWWFEYRYENFSLLNLVEFFKDKDYMNRFNKSENWV